MFKPIEWKGDSLEYLDQTRLPSETLYHKTADYRVVAQAIKTLAVRGAPLIGVAAAYGFSLGALEFASSQKDSFRAQMTEVEEVLRQTRPTAVNLFWALDRMHEVMVEASRSQQDTSDVVSIIVAEARLIEDEDAQTNQAIARFGASLFKDGDTVLTHCNAGVLACSAWGTALGSITWAATRDRKKIQVYADETRPLLQGARLTACELMESGIPVTLICDNMAGHYMAQGGIDKVMVGADRIASNGDVANKIGTYTVAVLSRYHGIPFYVAAPLSTIDWTLKAGDQIPIEQRKPEEVSCWNGIRTSPLGVSVGNPAFDITPGSLIDGIVTERGILYPPYQEAIQKLGNSRSRKPNQEVNKP